MQHLEKHTLVRDSQHGFVRNKSCLTNLLVFVEEVANYLDSGYPVVVIIPLTRGHSLKLVNNRYHYDLRKFSFAPRIVNAWNSLPEIVISADTTDTFKRLDKFWQHQDILYKVELTGVGSQINADDNIANCTFALLIFRLHAGQRHMPTPITHLCFPFACSCFALDFQKNI